MELDNVVDQIQKVRAKNNKLWMDLLRLAITISPKEAKKILKNINKNDKEISRLLGGIR